MKTTREDQEALQGFKDNQRKELEQKEIDFEEERSEIIKKNQLRIKAIHDKRENIEESLLKVLLQEKSNINKKE